MLACYCCNDCCAPAPALWRPAIGRACRRLRSWPCICRYADCAGFDCLARIGPIVAVICCCAPGRLIGPICILPYLLAVELAAPDPVAGAAAARFACWPDFIGPALLARLAVYRLPGLPGAGVFICGQMALKPIIVALRNAGSAGGGIVLPVAVAFMIACGLLLCDHRDCRSIIVLSVLTKPIIIMIVVVALRPVARPDDPARCQADGQIRPNAVALYCC